VKNFTFVQPQHAATLPDLLAYKEGSTLPYAGGTDALARMKEGLITPEQVIDLKTIAELSGIKENKKEIDIGAVTTLSDLAAHPAIQAITGLREATLSVATLQLRNRGTVGGNLCQRPRCWYYRSRRFPCLRKGGDVCFAVNGENKYHAILGGDPCFIVHPSDLAPMLVALQAGVMIRHPRGENRLALEEFFTLPAKDVRHENVLAPQEIVTRILVPKNKLVRSHYIKFRERQSFDFAMVSVAVAAQVGGKAVRDLRIVYGGVAPKPWRARKAEEVLEGKTVTEELLAQAAKVELAEAMALDQNGYKIILAKNLLKRAMLELLAQQR
jgi:xanthine dehydrogenase YagS FAD-binding subunit